MLLGATCGTPFAQSVEALRYVGSHGIEIIQNRNGGARSAPAPAKARPLDARVVIPADAQAARDRDRLSILQHELVSETGALATKINTLQTPALRDKLPADELVRLKDGLHAHEQNIRSLNAEISRVKLNR